MQNVNDSIWQRTIVNKMEEDLFGCDKPLLILDLYVLVIIIFVKI